MATSFSDIWSATSKTLTDFANAPAALVASNKKMFDDLLTQINSAITELQAAQKKAQTHILTITDMQTRAQLEAQQAAILADMEEQVYSVWRAIRPYTNFFTVSGKVVSKLTTANLAILYAATSVDKLKLLLSRASALVKREEAVSSSKTPINMTMALVAGAGAVGVIALIILNKGEK